MVGKPPLRETEEVDSSQGQTTEGRTWSPPRLEDYNKPSTSKTVKPPSSCPHCGESVQTPEHFPYKWSVYCGATAEDGQTLEEWLMDRGVPRTTIWRLKNKHKEMVAGTLTPRKGRTCSRCGERMVRATGHTILTSARTLMNAAEQWSSG
ncbi:hypothetical protein VZT92_022999 [Zoarces viviparus]|uniref:Uncharacterized protein n=1 Tax=Zoarces viviparus TaxID=48416 RepID=A0AAW1E5A7_ZOAVI